VPPQRSRTRPTRRSRTPAWTWWVVAGVIVVAVVVGVLVQQSRSGTEQATVRRPASAVGTNGGSLVGQADAPVTITEYGDFQCPGCARLYQLWSPTIDQLVQQGRARFEFVALAFLDQGTTESLRSAAASVCAGDAGKFLEYENVLYMNQSSTENSGFLTDQRLVTFGNDAGITDPSFASCVRTGRFDGWVRRQTDAASRRGVTETPTVLINGRQVSSTAAADPAQLTALVDQASR
jgi:protein-disulfide isomerase